MRGALRIIVGCGLLGLLGACAHEVSLTPLDGGEPGYSGTFFRGAPLMVKLDGKVYRGRWLTGAEAARAPLIPVAANAPVQVGRFYGQRGASGPGVADFTAKDGSSLVCRFRFERGQDTGSGLCQSDRGRTYSLVID